MQRIPELLAPAGDLEKLKIAVAYGADAVYIGGKRFGLRAFAGNFENNEIVEAVEYAHKHGRRVYVTLNIFAHNDDFDGMAEYIRFISKAGVDAVIVSDPGILLLVKDTDPEMEIHLSTQANTTNWKSALFWHEMGVKRIILARELSLDEIMEIRDRTPDTLELEVFVHGAMCISYSGRCMLSNYLAGRDPNRGACAHPCRWKYYLVEEKRPGEYLPVMEDDRGSYILNSKDLCMLGHIRDLAGIGLNGFKIEGRMKSGYYVAVTVKAYRQELDKYKRDPNGYIFDPAALEEIKKASHRPYTTGFYFGKPTQDDNQYSSSQYIRNYDFIALVLGYDYERNMAVVEQRNPFRVGDNIEIFSPAGQNMNYTITQMLDEDGQPIENAPHPKQKVCIPIKHPLEKYSIFRRKKI
ncbi:MAG: U32 family peptidase [Clostridiales bacterium]|jgi:putative protease|nr:U32 family peptidase [Clostridiales bacterium]